MDRRFHDTPSLRAVAAGAPAPAFDDGTDDPDGPSFLPPMRRRSRKGRSASRSTGSAAGATSGAPTAPQVGMPRATEPQRPVPPARSTPAKSAPATPSGWMTDLEQLALADAPPAQPDWPNHFSRPAPLRPTTPSGFAEPAFRPKRAGRWLRPAFPWLAPRTLGLLASLVLLGGVIAGVAAVMGGSRPPVAAAAPAAQHQLRHLVGQLEECRGIESLLVMLPVGAERDATLVRLKRQQVSIDAWLRDNGPQLTAWHGPQALMELRESVRAWHVLQQRVAEAEVVQARTGLARESRQLLTGPSAEAYRQLTSLVERLSLRQPS